MGRSVNWGRMSQVVPGSSWLLAQDTLNSSPPALFTTIFTLLTPFLTRLAATAP